MSDHPQEPKESTERREDSSQGNAASFSMWPAKWKMDFIETVGEEGGCQGELTLEQRERCHQLGEPVYKAQRTKKRRAVATATKAMVRSASAPQASVSSSSVPNASVPGVSSSDEMEPLSKRSKVSAGDLEERLGSLFSLVADVRQQVDSMKSSMEVFTNKLEAQKGSLTKIAEQMSEIEENVASIVDCVKNKGLARDRSESYIS